MKNPLAIGAATLAVILSLGLVACGSDDDGSSNEDVLTKQELIAEADAICEKSNEELDTKLEEEIGDQQPSQEEITSLISDTVVPHYEQEIDELRNLQPDEADQEEWNNIIDTLESELQVVKDDPEAASQLEDPFTESSAAAKDFGLEVCGSN